MRNRSGCARPAVVLTLSLLLATCSYGGGGGGISMDLCVLVSTCSSEIGETLGVGDACNFLFLAGPLAAAGRGSEASLAQVTLGCIKQSKTCDDLEACVKASESEAAVCAAAGGSNRCSGNVLVECSGYPEDTPDAFDCAAAGLVCGQGATSAECGLATCDPLLEDPYCDGDLLVRCEEDSGVLVSQDCRYYLGVSCSGINGGYQCSTRAGGTCGTGLEGEIACVGTGAACDDGTFTNRCDGSVLVTCNRGKESRVDCRDIHRDLTCRINQTYGAVECQPEKNECQVDGDESCQAGVITTCLLGEIAEVDCARYGYSGCNTAQDGTRIIAYCVP